MAPVADIECRDARRHRRRLRRNPHTRDLRAVLPDRQRCGSRPLGSQAVDVLGERLDGSLPQAGRARVMLGGQTVDLAGAGSANGAPEGNAAADGAGRGAAGFPGDFADGDPVLHRPAENRNMSTRKFLLGSAFHLSTTADDGTASGTEGVWTLWGQTAAAGFKSVPEDGLSLDGDVISGWLGLDYAGARGMAGLAVSHGEGRGDFDWGIEDGQGDVASSMTSLHPYLRWSPRADLQVWGLLGLGRGELRMEDARGRVETAIGMRMAAVGSRAGLASAGGVDLSVKTDALGAWINSRGVPGLPAVDAEVQRLRLMLEGRSEWALSAADALRPHLELVARLDRGDAERGAGLEVGGGVGYENTVLGLSAEAQGHWLAAHSADGFEEWRAKLGVRLDPGISGLGPSFSLTPVWGQASRDTDTLWESDTGSLPGETSADTKPATPSAVPDRLDIEIGYGLAAPGGRGIMTPYGELRLEDGKPRHLRVSLRLEVPGLGGGLQAEIFTEQTLKDDAVDDHRVGFTGSLRF